MGNRGCVKGVRMGEGVKAMCEKKITILILKLLKMHQNSLKMIEIWLQHVFLSLRMERGGGGGKIKNVK